MRLTVVLFADNKRGPSSVSCCALWVRNKKRVTPAERYRFDPILFHVGFLVDKVTQEMVFLPVLLSSPVCDSPPMLYRRYGQRR